MISRLTFKLTILFLVLTVFSFAGIQVIRNTALGRLWQLTVAQRRCVQQMTNNPIYVEKQSNNDSTAIGYLINDDYYVAVFNANQSGECHIMFQEKVWHLETFGAETSYAKKDEISPQRIQQVQLINSQDPAVYIWFDILGVGKNSNAKHIFFAKQTDNSYQAILTLELCVRSSSVQFTEQNPPTVMATNDRLCDSPTSNMQSFAEYSLWDGRPVILRAWSAGEFR